MYMTNGKTFDKISEAKPSARASLAGRPADNFETIYAWETASWEIGGGFWNPIARAEYRGNQIVVTR
jgi:hypothetical protein